MRLARRAAVLTVLLAALAAPPASAAFAGAIPIHLSHLAAEGRVAGPALAGDAVVWGQPVRDGFQVTVERSGASVVRTIPLPGSGGFEDTYLKAELEASETRAVLHLKVVGCSGSMCDDRGVLYDRTLTWELDGGDFVKLAGCDNESACAAAPCAEGLYPPDASGEVVAYSDCDGTHVRDFQPGATPAGRDYPTSPQVRVAGSFLARTTYDDARHDHPRARVLNWRTGEELYSMPDAEHYDIQDDGKLAFGSTYDVKWASPAEPTAHPARERWPFEVRVAGDRVAVRYDSGLTYRGLDVDVARLDGSQYSASAEGVPWIHDPWADGEAYDFDGERLARLARVCLRSWILVENVDGPNPPAGVVEANCPVPRVVPGSGWLDRKHRLRVRLACPVSPDVGCVGVANTTGQHPDDRDPSIQRPYAIRAGTEKTIRVQGRPKPLCRARNGRARARLTLSVYLPNAYIPEPPWHWIGRTVRARGHTRGLPRCTA